MDLSKFKDAFEKMDYDSKKSPKALFAGLRSTIIITESADLNSAVTFISSTLQQDDRHAIREILVQESISKKFVALLTENVKSQGSADDEIKKLSQKGFEVIGNRIVKCPSNLIASDSSVITLDVFRTSKEGLSLSKAAISVNLWCQNISISFEYINGMLNAHQIWLNSSYGLSHPKIPLLVQGKVLCEEPIDGKTGSLIEVADNVQFQTTFRDKKFKTVVIPFGETFAN